MIPGVTGPQARQAGFTALQTRSCNRQDWNWNLFFLFLCYFEKILWTNFVEKKKLKFRHLYFTYMNNMWQVVGIWTRAAATASRIGFWNWNPWCCYRKPHMLIVGIWTRAAATANHGYTICQIWNDKIAKYMRHIYKCEKVKLTIVVEGSCV